MNYTTWKGKSRIAQDESLVTVKSETTQRNMGAVPILNYKISSPWLSAPKQALSGLQKVVGPSRYRAFAGCCTWLNGVYWIRILDKRSNGDLLVENLHDVGKIKVKHMQSVIEPNLVYPLLRGRDVRRWQAGPSGYIILGQDPERRKGIPESEMKRLWPKTYAYFKKFEGGPKNPEAGTLRGRSGYRKYFNATDPFYSMYNVGPYTMANWKVLWPEVGHSVRASVSGPSAVEIVKPSLPDHTVVAVSCSSESEAYFVSGMLNSSPANLAVAAYIVLHPSPHIMKNIAVPLFRKNNRIHKCIAELSRKCHLASNNENRLSSLEAEVDEAVAKIWGITRNELKSIQHALLNE